MDLNKLIISTVLYTLSSLTSTVDAEENTIKGKVLVAKKDQPLSYCSITFLNSSMGTQTDENGMFEIGIEKESSDTALVISHIGYTNDTVRLNPNISDYLILLYPSQNSLNEIVVTGQSRSAEIKEDPAAIRIIDGKTIEQTTESNIIDVLSKNIPGLNAVKSGPNVSKPYIRGLGYNRVITLYDGVPQEGQQFEDEEVLAVDMYNIDRSEIILGPSSLQYGPEALAGVINLIPATPRDTDKLVHGRFLSEYQSNNGLIGNGLRLNYGNKNWSFVARGSYRIAKNFSNKIDGKVYNTGFRELNVSGSVIHKTERGYSDLNFSVYDNAQGIPDGSRDSVSRKFTKAVLDDPEDDIATRPVVSDPELNSYILSPIYQRIRHFRVYNKNQYDLKNGDHLYSMISFQQNQRKEHDFPVQKDLLGVSMKLNTCNFDFRYELLRLPGTEFLLGLNGAWQTNKNIDAHDIPIPDYRLLDIGSFFMAKWKHKNWTINSGFRFDTRYIIGRDFYTREDTTTELLSHVFVPDTSGAELLFPAFQKTYIGTSFNFGASYHIADKIILKANIAQGFRPPHVSEFASNGLDGSAHSYFIGKNDLRSEYNWQIDLGSNFQFRDISFSINIFNNYVRNYIYLVQLVDEKGDPIELIEGNKTFQYQQNNADLAGLESSIDIHPAVMKGFQFTSALSIIYGFNLDKKYKDKGVNGHYLPMIPPLRLLSALTQDIRIPSKIFPLITLRAETDFNSAQKRYLALNSTETQTPAYCLLNASVNFSIRYSKRTPLQLQFQVNNLLNKAYQSNLSRLKYFEYYPVSTGNPYGIYNMGRNMTVRLILPF